MKIKEIENAVLIKMSEVDVFKLAKHLNKCDTDVISQAVVVTTTYLYDFLLDDDGGPVVGLMVGGDGKNLFFTVHSMNFDDSNLEEIFFDEAGWENVAVNKYFEELISGNLNFDAEKLASATFDRAEGCDGDCENCDCDGDCDACEYEDEDDDCDCCHRPTDILISNDSLVIFEVKRMRDLEIFKSLDVEGIYEYNNKCYAIVNNSYQLADFSDYLSDIPLNTLIVKGTSLVKKKNLAQFFSVL